MNMNNKPRILILIGIYLPGVKGGGPIRTIQNLVSRLSNEFDFFIITSDRDLNDIAPYPDIELDKWIKLENINIYYSSDRSQLHRVINKLDYDLLYINSFFNSDFSIKPLLWMKTNKIQKKPIILAPRGELFPAALKIKRMKKKLFISIAKRIGLHSQNITWQGSSEEEKKDILQFLSIHNIPYKNIIVASDLANLKEIDCEIKEEKNNKELRICFLSRIAKIKNLRYALEILTRIEFPVFLGIYGPLEDKQYWDSCLEFVKKLPSNIHIEYYGLVENEKVQKTIAQYDLFFVPTQSENYGHVFIEALSAGTPILLSNNTPWRDLENKGIGWDLPLEDKDLFIDAINKYYQLDNEQRYLMKKRCIAFASSVINNQEELNANRNMFLDLL